MPALPVELTIETARVEGERLAASVATDPLLDARPLQRFDTAALAVLLQCRRSAAAAGQSLRIEGAPAKLVELAELYGAAELLSLVPAPSA